MGAHVSLGIIGKQAQSCGRILFTKYIYIYYMRTTAVVAGLTNDPLLDARPHSLDDYRSSTYGSPM